MVERMEHGNRHKLLVIDDEPGMRELLDILLSREGYAVDTAGSGQEALAMLGKGSWDLLLCDIVLGDISGLEVLRMAKRAVPEPVVIMISAYASTETAVMAMNEGAFDYIPKPFDNDELRQAIHNALSRRTLEREKEILREQLEETYHFGRIVGGGPSMLKLFSTIRQAAPTKTSILITGESGTGKELIARAIHEQSPRVKAPFVPIHCGGIPESLMESELFGHLKGSFTGATHDKKGLFEVAAGGTVFLDEVGELTHAIQIKLLRALQERVIKPVGGTHDIPVDIRIVSATNKNLEDEIIKGNFREDLYYRLCVIEIKVPPLRERKEDLRPLAQHFLDKYAKEMGKKIDKLSSYALDLLSRYDFPGNVRELENIIERSVALSTTKIILPDSLTLSSYKRSRLAQDESGVIRGVKIPSSGVKLDEVLAEVEKLCLDQALEMSGGVKHKAAKLLGVSIDSFRYRYDKYHSEPLP